MNQCKVQYKRERERVRVNGSNAIIAICFEARAPSSTSPPSHRRISTNSSTQDFPHREPPLRIWDNYNWVVLLSPTNTTSTLRGKAQNKSPLHLEGQAQSHSNTITSHLRDSNTISTSHQRDKAQSHHSKINLYTRGISQIRRVYNLVVSTTTNYFFSKKTKILIDRIE